MSDYILKILLTANGSTTTLEPISGTPTSVELSNLLADTDYEVEIILQRDGGNIDVASDSETFKTLSDIDENTPFYLEDLSGNGATFTLTKNGTPTSTDLSYSLDNETWTMFDLTTATNTVEVPANGKVYLRSSTGFSNSTSNYFTLGMSERFKACGNIMNLLNYNELDTGLIRYCFNYLFSGASNLVDASSLLLPTTTLSGYCYYSMFRNCTSLTTAPKLPATTLAEGCYYGMFSGCTSLTTAPELSVTTLAGYCYDSMFYNCTSLTTAPVLPATTLANYCYRYMFSGCTSLTTAPELPAETLARNCYESMFFNCTSLTTAPELPATTLADNCYHSMFRNCTSLTTAPELPATTLVYQCYEYMFYGCSSLTTAPKLPATTPEVRCYGNMFNSCTSLTTAPELLVTTLAYSCYEKMFYGCTNLQSVTTYCVNWSTSSAANWLYNAGTNATETPTLYCPTDSTLKTYTDNINGIPTGWTQVDL